MVTRLRSGKMMNCAGAGGAANRIPARATTAARAKRCRARRLLAFSMRHLLELRREGSDTHCTTRTNFPLPLATLPSPCLRQTTAWSTGPQAPASGPPTDHGSPNEGKVQVAGAAATVPRFSLCSRYGPGIRLNLFPLHVFFRCAKYTPTQTEHAARRGRRHT